MSDPAPFVRDMILLCPEHDHHLLIYMDDKLACPVCGPRPIPSDDDECADDSWHEWAAARIKSDEVKIQGLRDRVVFETQEREAMTRRANELADRLKRYESEMKEPA